MLQSKFSRDFFDRMHIPYAQGEIQDFFESVDSLLSITKKKIRHPFEPAGACRKVKYHRHKLLPLKLNLTRNLLVYLVFHFNDVTSTANIT